MKEGQRGGEKGEDEELMTGRRTKMRREGQGEGRR